MTNFVKANFRIDGPFVTYPVANFADGYKFVARFKHLPASKGTFLTFLVKHFTVEEYFAHIDNGIAPLTILENKGYILPHVKKLLKRFGYPLTKAGFTQYVKDEAAKRDAFQAAYDARHA